MTDRYKPYMPSARDMLAETFGDEIRDWAYRAPGLTLEDVLDALSDATAEADFHFDAGRRKAAEDAA